VAATQGEVAEIRRRPPRRRNGLAIAGNTLVAGAPYEDSCATGVNGNQSNNSCGPPPDSTPGDNNFPPPTFGAGAVYVYVLQ